MSVIEKTIGVLKTSYYVINEPSDKEFVGDPSIVVKSFTPQHNFREFRNIVSLKDYLYKCIISSGMEDYFLKDIDVAVSYKYIRVIFKNDERGSLKKIIIGIPAPQSPLKQKQHNINLSEEEAEEDADLDRDRIRQRA